MRRSLWIIPGLILIGAMDVPNAQADTYDAVYTCAACAFLPVPTNNPISFPLTVPEFVDITYDGVPLEYTLFPPPDNDHGDEYSWTVLVDTSDNFFQLLVIDDLTTGTVVTTSRFHAPDLDFVPPEHGSLTFTATTSVPPVPEPGTGCLFLIGIGLLVLMSKCLKFSAFDRPLERIAHNHIPDSI